jgi:hypothetical protein
VKAAPAVGTLLRVRGGVDDSHSIEILRHGGTVGIPQGSAALTPTGRGPDPPPAARFRIDFILDGRRASDGEARPGPTGRIGWGPRRSSSSASSLATGRQ